MFLWTYIPGHKSGKQLKSEVKFKTQKKKLSAHQANTHKLVAANRQRTYSNSQGPLIKQYWDIYTQPFLFFSSVLIYIFIFELVRYFFGQCVRGLVWLVGQGKRHQFESFLQKLFSGYCQRIFSIFFTLQIHFSFLGTSLKVFLFLYFIFYKKYSVVAFFSEFHILSFPIVVTDMQFNAIVTQQERGVINSKRKENSDLPHAVFSLSSTNVADIKQSDDTYFL